MPAPAKPKPPPWWLRIVLPSLEGLTENPLYLRLSGQGYGGGPKRLFRGRQGLVEFQRPQLSFFNGLGFPLLLWWGPFGLMMIMQIFLMRFMLPARAAPGAPTVMAPTWFMIAFGIGRTVALLCWFVGMIMFFVRLLSRGRTSSLKLFLANAGGQAWGEMLYLSPMRAEEYDRAMLAALLDRETRGLVVAVAVLASLPLFVFVFVGAARVDPWPEIAKDSLGYVKWAAPIALAAFLELFTLTAFNYAAQVWSASGVARGDWAQRSGVALLQALIFLLIHLPGVVLISLFFGWLQASQLHQLLLPPAPNFSAWQTWMIVAYLFAVPTFILGVLECQYIFRTMPGRLGEAMAMLIRRRYGE